MHATFRFRNVFLLWVTLSLGVLTSAWAQSNAELPVQIEADQFRYNEKTKISIFQGNVILTRGKTRVECDELEMQRDAKDNVIGQARGKGRQVQISSSNEQGELIDGHAQLLDFDTGKQTGVLRGNAFLLQTSAQGAQNKINGEVINLNWDNQNFQATGSDKGRVKLVLTPKS